MTQHIRPVRSLWSAMMVLAVLALSWAGGTRAGAAAELVMFESPTCHYCEQWHAELGPIYPKTAESDRAPLRRVNLHQDRPADLRDIRAVSFTPTFVLVDAGREVGRITGYAGDEFFWFQLSELLKKLPPAEDGAAQREGGS